MEKKTKSWFCFIILYILFFAITGSCKKDKDDSNPSTVLDVDGNLYHTVTIGSQVWLKEYLQVMKYNNLDPITNVTGNTEWSNLNTGAYCNYNNNSSNVGTYGRLYNWYAVIDSRKICPTGWHVPSNEEWNTLVTTLGGEATAGGKLKESGTIHWNDPNTGADNSSGFTALPGGYRYANGSFFDIQNSGFFWTSTGAGDNAYSWELFYNDGAAYENGNNDAKNGYSVRCIKD